jgi:PleD family two-component response regulator
MVEDNKQSILVVDDTQANLRFLTATLTRRGYIVRPALDGQLAIASAQAEPPDLILLDIMMPNMDGYQVCEALKADARTRDIPVIFLSALGQATDKVRAFEVGGVDYITKPFQVEEVMARVATHLALSTLQKQLEKTNEELAQRNAALQEALDTIKTLSGLIPICAWCSRKIENEEGQWVRLETYIQTHSEATFTHGMCPDCEKKMKAEAEEALQARLDLGLSKR